MPNRSRIIPVGLEVTQSRNGYLIIHTPSGKSLDWFAIHWRAIKAAQELGELGNWTKPEKSVLRFGLRKMKKILDKWQF